jgi:hypothetical protein
LRVQIFLGLGRMFMAHLHRWALAFLGFWVGGLLLESPQAARRRQPVIRNRVAGSANLANPPRGKRLDLRRRGAFWLQEVST